jgi:CubicO group peptidase (beta-lactamase class C family)
MTTGPGQGPRDWTPDPRALAVSGITAALQPGIDAGRYPGAQVYASVRGDVLADVAIGEGRLGTRSTPSRPMTSSSVVSWQCNTKPVTAVAVCQLWERGVIDIDRPLADYVPEFGVHGKDAVTIRQLLSHTVRFAADPPPGAMYAAAGPEQLDAIVCDSRMADGWEPGTKARYSLWAGYSALGILLRRVDGRPHSAYVRDEIFTPLGMDDCWIGVQPELVPSVVERMAFVYVTSGPRPELPLIAEAQGKRLDRGSPATGGVGPMRQLARLYESLLASLRGEPSKVLGTDTVREMVRVPRLGENQTGPWGLGMQVASGFYGHWFPHAFGHEGLQFSLVFADPDHDLVVAATVNGLARDARGSGSLYDLLAVSRAVYDALPTSA